MTIPCDTSFLATSSLRASTSARCFTAASLKRRLTISCRSLGNLRQASPFPSSQKPSHMWFVIEMYFWTS